MTSPTGVALDWTDYVAIALVILVVLAVSVYFTVKKTSTLAEYIWGGGDLGLWPVVGSLIATNTTPVTFFLATEVYQYGVNIMFELVTFLAMIVFIKIQIPVLCRLKLVSLTDYVALRFDGKVKAFASLITVFNMAWGLVVMGYTAGVFFSQITGLSLTANFTIILVTCYLLSALSGFKGVIWTDAVQAVSIFITLIILLVLSLNSVGRIDEILKIALKGGRLDVDWSFDPTKRLTVWSALCYGTQYISLTTLVAPIIYQRYSSMPDEITANRMAVVHITGVVIIRAGCSFMGLIVYAMYAGCDPVSSGSVQKYDHIFPFFIQEISRGRAFVRGLFVVGYGCAAFSTLTTLINTLSISLYKDYLAVKFNPKDQFTRAKRLIQLPGLVATVLCCSITYLLQFTALSIVDLTALITFPSALYSCILMTGMFFPSVSSKSVFWGGILGSSLCAIYAVSRQLLEVDKHIIYPTKLMLTERCPSNFTLPSAPELQISMTPDEDFSSVLRISMFFQFFMAYAVISLCMLSCHVILGPSDTALLDKKLVSPLVRSGAGNAKSPLLPINLINNEKELDS